MVKNTRSYICTSHLIHIHIMCPIYFNLSRLEINEKIEEEKKMLKVNTPFMSMNNTANERDIHYLYVERKLKGKHFEMRRYSAMANGWQLYIFYNVVTKIEEEEEEEIEKKKVNITKRKHNSSTSPTVRKLKRSK